MNYTQTSYKMGENGLIRDFGGWKWDEFKICNNLRYIGIYMAWMV